jgi:hypothetical protein
MLDEELKDLLILELKDTAQSLLREHLAELFPKEHLLKSEIESFYRVYRKRPLVDNAGGSGFHNSFWLFLLARLMRPNLIVESGVWKGHTTWLLEQACPDARICGFDINLGHLEYKDGKAEFYESDWSQHTFGKVDPEKSLCFFDCHVNHARRIIEAHERGFRHLLFDDNPPDYKLYSYRRPAFPTVDMVVNSRLRENQAISWYWQGTRQECRVDLAEAEKAKRMVKRYFVLPDVGGATRYGGFSFLSYVELEIDRC